MISINKIIAGVLGESGWVVTDTITQAQFHAQTGDLAVQYALEEVHLLRYRRKHATAAPSGGHGVRRKGIRDGRDRLLSGRRGGRRRY